MWYYNIYVRQIRVIGGTTFFSHCPGMISTHFSRVLIRESATVLSPHFIFDQRRGRFKHTCITLNVRSSESLKCRYVYEWRD